MCKIKVWKFYYLKMKKTLQMKSTSTHSCKTVKFYTHTIQIHKRYWFFHKLSYIVSHSFFVGGNVYNFLENCFQALKSGETSKWSTCPSLGHFFQTNALPLGIAAERSVINFLYFLSFLSRSHTFLPEGVVLVSKKNTRAPNSQKY